jgi:hypothetical protein
MESRGAHLSSFVDFVGQMRCACWGSSTLSVEPRRMAAVPIGLISPGRAPKAVSMMFVADSDSLLRVVYVIIRDGFPPPGLRSVPVRKQSCRFSSKAPSPVKKY